MKNRTMAVVVVALVSLLGVGAAQAQIQKTGRQVFPGKLMIGVHPIGVTVDFRGDGAAYKIAFDIAGRIAEPGPLGLYLGGGFNYGVGPRLNYTRHYLEPWIFVMLTFEKLIPIPLVPFIQAGIGTDVYFTDGSVFATTFAIRLGAGAHYWIVKNVGLGVETHFNLGPIFSNTNPVVVDGYGQWDFLLGARFHVGK